jgi:hypothetical protein
MKLLTGWVVSAGLVLAVSAAQAQMLTPYDAARSPYRAVSDFDGPPAPMPPEPLPYHDGQGYGPGYGPASGPGYGYGPAVLPPREVYAVLRESGFSPLGIPRQHGFVFVISAIDSSGEDGRLVIDARTGRILRFVPASRWGEHFDDELSATYGPEGALPPPTVIRGVPRPPAPIPRMASRSVPVPRPAPVRAADPSPQTAEVQAKPADAPVTTGTVGEARPTTLAQPATPPAPAIRPTQEMPQVQGLE